MNYEFTPPSDIKDRVNAAYKKARITFRVRFICTIISYASLFAWFTLITETIWLFFTLLAIGAIAGVIACPTAIPKVTVAGGKFWYKIIPIFPIDLLGYLIGFGIIVQYIVFAPFIVNLFCVHRAYRDIQDVRLSFQINGIEEPKKDRSKVQFVSLLVSTILVTVSELFRCRLRTDGYI